VSDRLRRVADVLVGYSAGELVYGDGRFLSL
jgi:hypothetical protein